jgi:hypothetical protein
LALQAKTKQQLSCITMKKVIFLIALAISVAACQRTKPGATAEPGTHAGVDSENRIGGHPDEGLAVDTSNNKYDHQIHAPEVAKEAPKADSSVK